MAEQPDPQRHTRRDAESLLMLGAFITILAIPVIIGTAFADTNHSRVVNATSGVILLLVGLAFLWRGLKYRRS